MNDDREFDDVQELVSRFEPINSLRVSDFWDRIETLAGQRRSRLSSRWVAGAAASVMVVAAVAALIWAQGRDDDAGLAQDPSVTLPAAIDSTTTTVLAPAATATTAATTSEPAATPAITSTSVLLLPVEPFGNALVEPTLVTLGDRITITPAIEIQGICTSLAIIYRQADTGPMRVGVLGISGSWQTYDVGSAPTFPACLPDVSARSVSYEAPPLADGSYILCLTSDVSADGCGSFIAANNADVPTTISSTTLAPSADDGNPLLNSLLLAGAGVDSAPGDAVTLGEAVFCGIEDPDVESYPGGERNNGARRCFFDRYLARVPAVFVDTIWSIEAEPIVTVWRGNRDGTVEQYVDSTRDTFGSGSWRLVDCGRLSTAFPTAPDVRRLTFRCEPFTLESAGEVAMVQSWPSDPNRELPREFAQRRPAFSCGYVIRMDDAHEKQSACFREVIESGNEAEIAYVVRDDSGEPRRVRSVRWFRVDQSGALDVFEQRVTNTGIETWSYSTCSTYTPGPTGLPQLDSCTIDHLLT